MLTIRVAAASGAGRIISLPRANVTYIPADQVQAAFDKAVLLKNGRCQIHASRPEAPGQVEVHVRDTDIISMLDGTTTLVTGGNVVGGESTTNEIRGYERPGRRDQTLSKGDVIVVPSGIPRWFKELPGPLRYDVVKVQ
jgi:hypothetical protein